MNKVKKMIYVSFVDAISFALTLLSFNNDFENYSVVLGTITIILFCYLVYLVFSKTDEKILYQKKIKNILKTYDSIIVYADKEVELNNENVILIKSLEDLMTAREEIKKPIIYYKENDINHFILKNEDEIMIFTMKLNEDIVSNYENKIKEHIEKKKVKSKKKKRILKDLEKTTIIKLDDNKFYKISPVKNKK